MQKIALICISLLLLGATVYINPLYAAAACPNVTDTKTNFDTATNTCYSQSDPLYNTGLNTQGGSRTCGPVRCPGDHTSPYNPGNTCIVLKNGQCFAGTGPSGFNTPGCTASSNTPLPACPPALSLKVKVNDEQGKPLANDAVTIKIRYQDSATGKGDGQLLSISKTTDQNGIITLTRPDITLYSGDHFTLKLSSSKGEQFSPTQIGADTNIGNQEMNTPSSCGTQMENGTYNTPCTFTRTATVQISVYPDNGTAKKQIPTDPTVFNAEQSVATTLEAVAVIGIIAVGINGMLGLGSNPKK